MLPKAGRTAGGSVAFDIVPGFGNSDSFRRCDSLLIYMFPSVFKCG